MRSIKIIELINPSSNLNSLSRGTLIHGIKFAFDKEALPVAAWDEIIFQVERIISNFITTPVPPVTVTIDNKIRKQNKLTLVLVVDWKDVDSSRHSFFGMWKLDHGILKLGDKTLYIKDLKALWDIWGIIYFKVLEQVK